MQHVIRQGLLWIGLASMGLCGLPAVAQVYAPDPTAPAQTLQPATAATTGNPFLNSPGPRATLLLPRRDDHVQPASFEQPISAPAAIGASDGMSAIHMPAAAPIPTPLPSSMPMPTTMANSPMPPLPPAAPPQSPPEAAAPPLRGLALLDSGGPGEHPLAPVIRWAGDALEQMQALRDFTGTFVKREWVDGRLQEQQVMYAKMRMQPYSVYLQFLAPADVKGQEALYVAGQNNGNLLAHPVGFKQALVGTISIAPDSPQAMDGNRHPITDFGLRRLLERYLEGALLDAQFGECDVQIIRNARVNDRMCTCIQVTHPQPRREFRFHLSRLYVDDQWNIPVRCENYAWPQRQGEQPQLIEEYTYVGLRLNAGLTDGDFDRRNPDYRF